MSRRMRFRLTTRPRQAEHVCKHSAARKGVIYIELVDALHERKVEGALLASLYCSRDPYRAHEHELKIRHPGGF